MTLQHRIVGYVAAIQKEPPTLQKYKNILLPKRFWTSSGQNTIEKATHKGMDGEKVTKLIELFADMAKNF
ncbi:MAG: hypothetical protein JM58_09230 [Peptococcaceae bacterium BICA1-8]|nr:MAG: hypothetical protein JM58_09230 [Peptococcaceae bacterium BICA1-8]